MTESLQQSGQRTPPVQNVKAHQVPQRARDQALADLDQRVGGVLATLLQEELGASNPTGGTQTILKALVEAGAPLDRVAELVSLGRTRLQQQLELGNPIENQAGYFITVMRDLMQEALIKRWDTALLAQETAARSAQALRSAAARARQAEQAELQAEAPASELTAEDSPATASGAEEALPADGSQVRLDLPEGVELMQKAAFNTLYDTVPDQQMDHPRSLTLLWGFVRQALQPQLNLPRQQYLAELTPKWDAGRPRTLLLLSPTLYIARFVAHVLRREIELQMGKLLADYFDECQVVYAPGREEPSMSDLPDQSRLLALAALPDELKALRQWVVWRYEARPGKDKPAKRPYSPGTGRPARTDTPATWGTWPQALARSQHGGWNGLGFVFTAADPYAGVDLDGCRDPETGEIAFWAQQIVDALDSYTEISPSGRGMHILVKAELPNHIGRKRGAVEVYDAQRYFAVTGERLAGTPPTIEERQAEVLALYATLAPVEEEPLARAAPPRPTLSRPDAEVVAKALAAANGAFFRALWNGDLAAYHDPQTGEVDQSRADFALCLLLAYWCNGDMAQIDRLFRQSALYRPKWDAQCSGHGRTYGQVTIWNALRRHERLVAAPAKSRR